MWPREARCRRWALWQGKKTKIRRPQPEWLTQAAGFFPWSDFLLSPFLGRGFLFVCMSLNAVVPHADACEQGVSAAGPGNPDCSISIYWLFFFCGRACRGTCFYSEPLWILWSVFLTRSRCLGRDTVTSPSFLQGAWRSCMKLEAQPVTGHYRGKPPWAPLRVQSH